MTISSTDPGDYRLRQQDALARRSTRGRHIVASHSGHWVPLDEPELVIAVIREMVDDDPGDSRVERHLRGSFPRSGSRMR